MPLFKGSRALDDSFLGTEGRDTFVFDPLELTRGDTIVGGAGFDTLRFTTPGAIGFGSLENVSGIDRIVLANGTNSLSLGEAFVMSADDHRVSVIGGAGDDLVYATDLDLGSIDFVSSGGVDIVLAGAGFDTFTFDVATLDEHDRISAGAGGDTLMLIGAGRIGAEQLAGISGIDSVRFGDNGVGMALSDAFLYANATFLTIHGGAGSDLIDASAVTYSNTLTLLGGDGDDTIIGGATKQFFLTNTQLIDGGAGADTISAGPADVVYDAADHSAAVSYGTLLIRGAAKIDLAREDDQSFGDVNVVTGFTTADASAAKVAVSLAGSAGDLLLGGRGDDRLVGGSTITGGRGADTMIGNETSTYFVVRAGDFARGEIIRGHSASDVLSISGTHDLRQGSVSGLDGLLLGTGLSDGSADVIATAAMLKDVDSIGGYASTLTVYMDGQMRFGTDVAITTYYGLKINVLGTALDETIANLGLNDVHAGGGDDVVRGSGSLYGGSGDDVLTPTEYTPTPLTIDGGSGSDLLLWQYNSIEDPANTIAIFDLANRTDQFNNDQFTITNVESVDLRYKVFYYAEHVELLGNHADNTLVAGQQQTVLDGRNGDDILVGGSSADQLTGGAGHDIFRWLDRGVADVVTDFHPGADTLEFVQRNDFATVYDLNGAAFDVLVTADRPDADIAQADLVIVTGETLSSNREVEVWLDQNGTGVREGIFLVAEDADQHAVLYYAPTATGDYFTVTTVADLGSVDPTTLTLSDFAFI